MSFRINRIIPLFKSKQTVTLSPDSNGLEYLLQITFYENVCPSQQYKYMQYPTNPSLQTSSELLNGAENRYKGAQFSCANTKEHNYQALI